MKKILLTAALCTGFSAHAALIDINAGTSSATVTPGVDMTITGLSDIGFQIDNATSVYFKSLDPSRAVSNNVIAGDYFQDVGNIGIGGLTLTTGTDTACSGSIANPNCYGNAWSLSASYNFYGVVAPVSPTDLGGLILGGFIDLNFFNGSTQKVASIAITGSSGPTNDSVGVKLNGVIDYSGFSTVTDFVKDFFSFSSPVGVGGVTATSWYDLWQAGVAASPEQFVNALLITTLSASGGNSLDAIAGLTYGTTPLTTFGTVSATGSPFQQNLFASYGLPSFSTTETASRTGERLSGNVSFNVVPEPASLAIFGAGLLGMGLVSRRRRNNDKK